MGPPLPAVTWMRCAPVRVAVNVTRCVSPGAPQLSWWKRPWLVDALPPVMVNVSAVNWWMRL